MVETCKKGIDQGEEYGALLNEPSMAFGCLVYDLVIAKFHARDMFLFHNNKGFFSYIDDSTSYYLGKSPEEVITKLKESSGTIFTKNKTIDLLKSYLF